MKKAFRRLRRFLAPSAFYRARNRSCFTLKLRSQLQFFSTTPTCLGVALARGWELRWHIPAKKFLFCYSNIKRTVLGAPEELELIFGYVKDIYNWIRLNEYCPEGGVTVDHLRVSRRNCATFSGSSDHHKKLTRASSSIGLCNKQKIRSIGSRKPFHLRSRSNCLPKSVISNGLRVAPQNF